MKRGRLAFAKLGIIGSGCRAHAAHIDCALGRTDQHNLTERNIIQAKVVSGNTRVLVQDSNGSRSGTAAVP